ncbi:MAG: hypothetical protein WCW35_04970 [Bacteroidota bacterium]|jgi:hypothetical protein
MTTILTTLYLALTLGYAVETTSLSVDTTTEAPICAEPIGQIPPPPVN